MATETRRVAVPTSGPARFFFKLFTGAHAGLYRLSGGRLGGALGRAPVLLLHTVGGRSGEARTNPLVYLRDEERFVVVGSAGGAARHPAWLHNLRRATRAAITVGRRRLAVEVREARDEERERLWSELIALFPRFGDYQRQTSREIPVVVLTPVGQAQ